MDYMQLNIQTNPASAGTHDVRHNDTAERAFVRRRRPTLSRRELRRIVAEMIG